MAVDLQGLAKVLETSLDPTQNKQCLLPTLVHRFMTKPLTYVNSGACYFSRGEEAQLLVIASTDCRYRLLQQYCSTR